MSKIIKSSGFMPKNITLPAILTNKKRNNSSRCGYAWKLTKLNGWTIVADPMISQPRGRYDGYKLSDIIRWDTISIPIKLRDGYNLSSYYTLNRNISSMTIIDGYTMYGHEYSIGDINSGLKLFLKPVQIPFYRNGMNSVSYYIDYGDDQSVKDFNMIKTDNFRLLQECMEKMHSNNVWESRFNSAAKMLDDAVTKHKDSQDRKTPETKAYPVDDGTGGGAFGGVDFQKGADEMFKHLKDEVDEFFDKLGDAIRDFDWKDVDIKIGFEDDAFDRDTIYALTTAFKPSDTSVNPNDGLAATDDTGKTQPTITDIIDNVNNGSGSAIIDPSRYTTLVYCYYWRVLGKDKLILRLPLKYCESMSYTFTSQITFAPNGIAYYNFNCNSIDKASKASDTLLPNMYTVDNGGYRYYYYR